MTLLSRDADLVVLVSEVIALRFPFGLTIVFLRLDDRTVIVDC